MLGDRGLRANGHLVALGRHSFGASYSVLCDAAGLTRRLSAHSDSALTDRGLSLTHTPGGPWQDGAGYSAPAPDLDVCLDVDLLTSVFTISLVVRRLRLQCRMADETVQLVQVGVPGLAVTAERHWFRTNGFDEKGASITHVGPGGERKFTVDSNGFVLDVPRQSYRLR